MASLTNVGFQDWTEAQESVWWFWETANLAEMKV